MFKKLNFYPLQRNDWFWALGVFIIALIVYILTLCPTVYTEDTGEFVTGSYVLGVGHPPGYPIYFLLGKLFTFIPLASIAWRVNLMSAVFAAGAGLFLFLLLKKILGNKYIAFSSALIFAFSKIFWSQAVIAEVYTLNIFFLALVLFILIIWTEKQQDKYLYLFALIYGLSICNHHLMALIGPVLAFYIIWTDWRILLRLKTILAIFLLFIIGLLPYLYLPIRAAVNPALNWGDASTWQGFIDHVSRKEYSDVTISLAKSINTKLKFLGNFFQQLAEQFLYILLIPGILGFYYFFKKDKKFLILTFLIFLLASAGLIYTLKFDYNPNKVEVVRVFYFPAYLIFTIWLGGGLLLIWQVIKKIDHPVTKAFIILLLIIPLIPLMLFYKQNNLSRNYIAYDFAKSVLTTVEPNGILFAEGDTTVFDFLYLQTIEKYRTDVQIYDHLGVVYPNYYDYDFYKTTLPTNLALAEREKAQDKIIEQNINNRPIYYLIFKNFNYHPEWVLQPAGLLFKVEPANQPYQEPNYWSAYNIRGLENPKIHKDFRINELILTYRERYIKYLLRQGEVSTAEEQLKKIEKINTQLPEETYNNIGLLYLEQGNMNKAREYFERVLEINPDLVATHFNRALTLKTTDPEEAIKEINYFIINWKQDLIYLEKAAAELKQLRNDDLKVEEYNNIGLNYMNRGLFEPALEYFNQVKEKDPTISAVYYNLAFSYQGLSQKKKAIENYEKFLELWPNNDNFRQAAEAELKSLKDKQ